MVSLVNSHTNATSKRWHLWEIDLRFALNSTPGWKLEYGMHTPATSELACVILERTLACVRVPPPSSEHGTYKTAKAKFWSWLPGKSP